MQRRRSSAPLSPGVETPHRLQQAQFLNEELDPFFTGRQNEDVQLPNLVQMLGFNPDAGDDHFAVANGMKTRWKRKLYLLMEEPSSGREAFFVHVTVTGAILFRWETISHVEVSLTDQAARFAQRSPHHAIHTPLLPY